MQTIQQWLNISRGTTIQFSEKAMILEDIKTPSTEFRKHLHMKFLVNQAL